MSINQPTTPPLDINIEDLSRDLSATVHKVKDIQQLVNSFIDAIVIRKNDETEKETLVIKSTITKVRAIRVELEKLGKTYFNLRLNNIHPIPLGNVGYVSLDPNLEQSGFYKQLLDCYRWLSNVDDDANKALQYFESKGTKSLLQPSPSFVSQTLKGMIGEIKPEFPHLLFNDSFVVPECCLVITIGKAFVVNITFSGLVVSHVLAKSMLEIHTLKPWEVSQHYVFQKISDVFSCKVIELVHLQPKDLLYKLLSYINAYRDIFSKTCSICGKHLNTDSVSSPMLPPVWKSMDGDQFYHLSCR